MGKTRAKSGVFITSLTLLAALTHTNCGGSSEAPKPPSAPATSPVPSATAVSTAAAVAPVEPVSAEDRQVTVLEGLELFVPAGWRVLPGPQVKLFDPENAILVTAERSQAGSGAAAIAKLWSAIRKEGAPPVERTIDAPEERNGYDSRVAQIYKTDPASGRILQAQGKQKGSDALAFIVDGDLQAIVKRQAQLQQITASLELPAAIQKEEDLSKVEPRAFSSEDAKVLSRFIAESVAEAGIPGLAVSVVQNGKIVFEEGFGVRELGKPAKVTPDTRFLIGSVTKSMTTLLMAKAVDRGLFGWDTPVVDAWPAFHLADETLQKRMHMQDLVCACTGLPRRDLPMIFEQNVKPEDVFKQVYAYAPTTKFGETFQYQNQLVAVAGFIAASTYKKQGDLSAAYADAMKNEIFTPLGMTQTTADFAEGVRGANRASSHARSMLGENEPFPLSWEKMVIPVAPAGAVWSTVHDLGLYVAEEMQEGVSASGTRVVSAANVKKRWEKRVSAGPKTYYGLGWGAGFSRGLRFLDHGGAVLGMRSKLTFVPEKKFGIAFLANGDGRYSVTRHVTDKVVALLFGAEDVTAKNRPLLLGEFQREQAEERAELDEAAKLDWSRGWLGAYTNPELGSVKLSRVGGRVMIDVGEWRARVLPMKPKDGRQRAVISSPPLSGLPLVLVGDAKDRRLVVEIPGQERYELIPAERSRRK